MELRSEDGGTEPRLSGSAVNEIGILFRDLDFRVFTVAGSAYRRIVSVAGTADSAANGGDKNHAGCEDRDDGDGQSHHPFLPARAS